MICPEHGVEMKKREKDGETWWSHKQADGSYCKGKGKKTEAAKKEKGTSKLEILKMVAPFCEDLDDAMKKTDDVVRWLNE